MRSLSILGSTGSIGMQVLDVVRSCQGEFSVVALASGGNNIELLAKQIKEFQVALVCLPDQQSAKALKALLGADEKNTEIIPGIEGLCACASSSADIVVSCLVGALGILPTACAIEKGKTIALANKETLVAAGSVIMPMVKQYGAKIIPIDSEHSAIHQCLNSYTNKDIKRLLLTGSGGPFRTWSLQALQNATIADALQHPNWSMGPKITIDSATLMNKGLEIIEARWLFDVESSRINVVIHPQSILHSAVEFVDGSILGQFGMPDMHLPIHYALFYPQRKPSKIVPTLDLIKIANLSFEEPDLNKFPCLQMAQDIACRSDDTAAVLNAANEVIVQSFLDGQIRFSEIPKLIEKVLNLHKANPQPTLDDILEADMWARQQVNTMLGALVK